MDCLEITSSHDVRIMLNNEEGGKRANLVSKLLPHMM